VRRSPDADMGARTGNASRAALRSDRWFRLLTRAP
jgi:hypothetical protein